VTPQSLMDDPAREKGGEEEEDITSFQPHQAD